MSCNVSKARKVEYTPCIYACVCGRVYACSIVSEKSYTLARMHTNIWMFSLIVCSMHVCICAHTHTSLWFRLSFEGGRGREAVTGTAVELKGAVSPPGQTLLSGYSGSEASWSNFTGLSSRPDCMLQCFHPKIASN